MVENPATSSPGLAFLLATIDRFGEQGWRDYWTAAPRQRRGGRRTAGRRPTTASFTAGEGNGERPLVVSYASSPAAAVYFSDPRPKQAPIGTVLDTCFDQVEFAGVLKGTSHQEGGDRSSSTSCSPRSSRRDIPLQMFVFPARDDARCRRCSERFAEVPARPGHDDADDDRRCTATSGSTSGPTPSCGEQRRSTRESARPRRDPRGAAGVPRRLLRLPGR